MNVNFEYYKVFYHVCACGSLTAAAQELCISQPAVSQAVRQLEKEAGTKLFFRTSKGVQLTREGELLYHYVKPGVEELLEGNDSRVHAHSLLEWVEPLEEETAEGMQSREHDHDHEEEALKNGAAEETAGGTEAFAEDAGVHLEEGEYDEHVWTSPANAILIVEKIRDTLISIDPDRAGIYEENARVYLEQLRSLDSDYRRVIGEAKRHTVIFGDRFPFLYLVKTYGLDYYAAFPGCSSETEPSAATIAFLTDEVKEEHIPVVFYLELSNAKVADAIAEVTGARTAMLHSCHTLTREEMQRGENYLSLMRQNLEQLKLALNE